METAACKRAISCFVVDECRNNRRKFRPSVVFLFRGVCEERAVSVGESSVRSRPEYNYKAIERDGA